MPQSDVQKRRNNILLALVLGAFALLIMLSSLPFWKGLFELTAGVAK